jgi:hypothetical protein
MLAPTSATSAAPFSRSQAAALTTSATFDLLLLLPVDPS